MKTYALIRADFELCINNDEVRGLVIGEYPYLYNRSFSYDWRWNLELEPFGVVVPLRVKRTL